MIILILIPLFLISYILFPYFWHWLSGKVDTFDPLALVCIYMFYLFVVVPIIHLITNQYSTPLYGDINSLLLITCCIYLGATLMFLLGVYIPTNKLVGSKIPLLGRSISLPILVTLSSLSVILTVFLYFYQIYQMGGFYNISSYIENRLSIGEGTGWFTIIRDIGFIGLLLIMNGFFTIKQKSLISKIKSNLLFVLVLFIITLLLFYQGGRAWILIYYYFGIVLYHYSIKRVKSLSLVIIAVIIIPFLHGYSVWRALGGQISFFEVLGKFNFYAKIINRPLLTIFTGDFGRTDVVMFIIQKVSSGEQPILLGETFLAAFLQIIPRSIWKTRPYGISEILTDMEYGKGVYSSLINKSSRVASFLGELYLNFHLPGVFIGFFLYGILVGIFYYYYKKAIIYPHNRLLLATISYLLIILISGNSHVWIFTAFKLLIPNTLILLLSQKSVIKNSQIKM